MSAALFVSLICTYLGVAQVPELSISISRSDSAELFTRDVFSNDYLPASVRFQGMKWQDARIRFKGRSNRPFPKKSFRVKFSGSRPFLGSWQINLHSLYTDESFLREALSWLVFDDLKTLAPHASYVWLTLNGDPQGLYLMVDRVDKEFLERRGRSPSSLYSTDDEFSLGDLVEQPEELLRLYYPKETRKNEGYGDLKGMLHELNTAPDSLFMRMAEKLFDIRSIEEWFTGNILMMMGDSYNKNYYLYRDDSRTVGPWTVIPWDYDISFGLTGDPAIPVPASLLNEGFGYSFPALMGPDNVLKDRLWKTSEFRYHLIHHVEAVLDSIFTEERMSRRIDSLSNLIRSDVEKDRKKRRTVRDFEESVDALKYFVRARRAYLLKTFVHPPSGSFDIVTLRNLRPGVPEHFVGVDGRLNATLWFSTVRRLDSITVLVHPDSLPPDLPRSESSRCVRRWLEMRVFPPSVEFTAQMQWMYEDLSSGVSEVPKGVANEHDLRCFWFDGRNFNQVASSLNPVSNTVILDSVTQRFCRSGMYFAIKLP